MKEKTTSLFAEYGIYTGGFVVLLFIYQQETIHGALSHFFTLGVLTFSVWIIGALLKYSIRKERPHVEKRLSILRDRYSFPSMHALTLSTVATYVSMSSLYLGLFIFLIAFIVMYARIRTHMHFAVDMVAGFFFGVVYAITLSPSIEKYLSLIL